MEAPITAPVAGTVEQVAVGHRGGGRNLLVVS